MAWYDRFGIKTDKDITEQEKKAAQERMKQRAGQKEGGLWDRTYKEREKVENSKERIEK